jgi:hypothetical protein
LNIGIAERWEKRRKWMNGILGCWVLVLHLPTHYSITPVFQYSGFSRRRDLRSGLSGLEAKKNRRNVTRYTSFVIRERKRKSRGVFRE